MKYTVKVIRFDLRPPVAVSPEEHNESITKTINHALEVSKDTCIEHKIVTGVSSNGEYSHPVMDLVLLLKYKELPEDEDPIFTDVESAFLYFTLYSTDDWKSEYEYSIPYPDTVPPLWRLV